MRKDEQAWNIWIHMDTYGTKWIETSRNDRDGKKCQEMNRNGENG